MNISVLIDNAPGVDIPTEFGLSYYIEYNGKHILFDTAQSNLFLANANKMSLDVETADYIVLSHGHFDHGNGLKYLKGGSLVCHLGCFEKRYRIIDKSYIGLNQTREQIERTFNLTASEKPFKLFDGAFFLGQIPRVTDFESRTTPFIFEDGSPDFVIDDSALAFKVNNGIFVITGCGHSGIVNTLEHAKRVLKSEKIVGIMGGFHLKENNRQTKETIAYLTKNKVEHVYPSHCTALPALAEFYHAFGNKQLKAGDTIRI